MSAERLNGSTAQFNIKAAESMPGRKPSFPFPNPVHLAWLLLGQSFSAAIVGGGNASNNQRLHCQDFQGVVRLAGNPFLFACIKINRSGL